MQPLVISEYNNVRLATYKTLDDGVCQGSWQVIHAVSKAPLGSDPAQCPMPAGRRYLSGRSAGRALEQGYRGRAHRVDRHDVLRGA
jgi:hypothetical protein